MRYEHQSCTECKPLGEYEGDDLWFCPQTLLKIPTVIARHSSEPGDYTSGMAFAASTPSLAEAKRRAIEEGYYEAVLNFNDVRQKGEPLCKDDPSSRGSLQVVGRLEYEQLGIYDEYGKALEAMLEGGGSETAAADRKRSPRTVITVSAGVTISGAALAAEMGLIHEAVERLRKSGQEVEVITIDSCPPHLRGEGEGGARRSALMTDGRGLLSRAFVERLRDMPVALAAEPDRPATHGPARRGKKGKTRRW